MTASNQVRGLWVPALTPFDTDLSVDPARFLAHCQWLLNNGANSLAAFGTTSEANSLSKEERKSLLDALIEGGIAPGQLMPGTGCCALPDTVELTRHAVEQGCAGVLLLPASRYQSDLGPVPQDRFRIGYGRRDFEEGLGALRAYLSRNRS